MIPIDSPETAQSAYKKGWGGVHTIRLVASPPQGGDPLELLISDLGSMQSLGVS